MLGTLILKQIKQHIHTSQGLFINTYLHCYERNHELIKKYVHHQRSITEVISQLLGL